MKKNPVIIFFVALICLVVVTAPAFMVYLYMDAELTGVRSVLGERIRFYRENAREPIMIDMGKNKLIVINKIVLRGQPTSLAMLDKNQNVRLLFWIDDDKKEYVKVFNDSGEHFSFLVPKEFVKKPFNLQITNGRGWNDLEVERN